MDSATTFMAANSLSQALTFMQHVFPWISLLALLFTALIVMLNEKRRRALRLEQSEAEARIRALDIDDAQKEQLLKAAALLPESREAFPLPDIPLRLVSALAKVFGFLKLILLFGAAYAMARIFVIPGSERSVAHPFLLALLVVGFMILAVLQIIASSKVTRGSNGARHFLIFMAVLDLGTALYDPNMAFALLWRTILVGMSGYTLWVLLLRKCAQEAVIFDSAPTWSWQKITLCGLSLLFAITVPFDAKMSAYSFQHKVETNMSSSDIGGTTLPVSRVFLQAGDDSRETSELMEYIKEDLCVPVELVEFGQAAPHTISGSDLLLLLSKTLDQKTEKLRHDPQLAKNLAEADPEFFKKWVKSNPEMLVELGSSYDEEIAFVIDSPFGHQKFAWNSGGSKMYGINSPDFRVSISAEYSRAGLKKTLVKVGEDAAGKLNEFILSRNAKITVSSLPEPLCIESDPLPAPNLDCMSDAVLTARYYAPGQQISLYQISEHSPNVMTTVSNELAAAGWEKSWPAAEGLNWEMGPEKITVLGPAVCSGQHSLPTIYIIHARSRPVDFPDSFPADLCRDHYVDFISIFRAKAVSEEVLRDATLKYLKQPDLSAKELWKVYSSISKVKALEAIRPNLLWRFAKQLHAEQPSEFVFGLYQDLAKEIATRNSAATNSFNRIKALYADQMVQLELVQGTNGFVRAETTLPATGRPQIVTFSGLSDSLPEGRRTYDPYFLLWQEFPENGQCKSYYDSPYGSGSSESSEFQGHRATLCGLLSDGYGHVGMISGGFSDQYCSIEDMTEPGNLTLLVYSNPDNSDELIVKVTLNENEPEEKIE